MPQERKTEEEGLSGPPVSDLVQENKTINRNKQPCCVCEYGHGSSRVLARLVGVCGGKWRAATEDRVLRQSARIAALSLCDVAVSTSCLPLSSTTQHGQHAPRGTESVSERTCPCYFTKFGTRGCPPTKHLHSQLNIHISPYALSHRCGLIKRVRLCDDSSENHNCC